jgi:hypothetical protein
VTPVLTVARRRLAIFQQIFAEESPIGDESSDEMGKSINN